MTASSATIPAGHIGCTARAVSSIPARAAPAPTAEASTASRTPHARKRTIATADAAYASASSGGKVGISCGRREELGPREGERGRRKGHPRAVPAQEEGHVPEGVAGRHKPEGDDAMRRDPREQRTTQTAKRRDADECRRGEHGHLRRGG